MARIINYITGGETHGPAITVIVHGIPANVPINIDFINHELKRRQQGYGRGGRMKIETDEVEIIGGVRHGKTTGAPIVLQIKNKDWENWKGKEELVVVKKPRPGHADLIGYLKYGLEDVRDVLERASARETVARVAIGAIAKYILKEFDIYIFSYVKVLGGIEAYIPEDMSWQEIYDRAENSPVRTPDPQAEALMIQEIDKAKASGDTLGGIVEVVVLNPLIGLGSHTHWEEKLDARIAFAVMSIQAVKGIEFGIGRELAYKRGSEVHDEIFITEEKRIYRKTNRIGGIEGGMSNGMPIIFRAIKKPISTLMKPLRTVNLETMEPDTAITERSDVTAVPALGVILENVTAIELLDALLKRYGMDDFNLIKKAVSTDPIQKHRNIIPFKL